MMQVKDKLSLLPSPVQGATVDNRHKNESGDSSRVAAWLKRIDAAARKRSICTLKRICCCTRGRFAAALVPVKLDALLLDAIARGA
jgi:hypothetical protein